MADDSYNWGTPPFPNYPHETVDSMAEIGEAFMDAMPKGYVYNQSPAEIIADLQNQRDDVLRLSDPLADWINRAGPALKNLLDAYERRVRSACTNEAEIAAEPWKCAEWLAAESVLNDKPIAVVELTAPTS